MKNILSTRRNRIIICLLVFVCAVVALCVGITGFNAAYAEEAEKTPYTDVADIAVQAYRLEDNKGYYASEDAKVPNKTHPLKKNLINLSVFTQSEISQAKVDEGKVSGYNGYGISGSSVAIQLEYNFSDPQNMKGQNGYTYSISSDTYQNVGEFKDIGVIGTGALLFQKKYKPEDNWEWQNKDGETKKQLHTFNFTDLAKPSEYNSGNKYTLYTPSGEDLSKGVFIKITFAYELKYTRTEYYYGFFGNLKSKEVTEYVNMLETAEFYIVQNSGTVLFHNASTFDKVGEEGETGAFSIDRFETILSGDVTLNGFRLDTLGVEAYDITYRLNGGEENVASNGQFFLKQGRYDFTINRKIGPAKPYTIFVDRREVNDAVVGYFGQGLFTEDSQRIYTTGEYPAYLADSATIRVKATDGTVAPIVGELFSIVTEGEKEKEIPLNLIKPKYGADYKAEEYTETISEVGIYKAEFWANPRYKDEDEISGDLYHFVFRFEIVDKDTPQEPSINEAYLNGLIGFSDLQSKYYSVALKTQGTGKAIFAFSDFSGAYDFAYKAEREKVSKTQNGYLYNGKEYATQYSVLGAVDEYAKNLVTVRYFDSTNPESYQTADIADEKLSELNFNKDVIVFTDDNEQSYMKAGTPSVNGRKYRYVSPETGEIEEGTLYFAFIQVAGFESSKITLTHKESGNVYDDIVYGVSVEYQLGLKNAPSGIYTVHEQNSFEKFSEYEVTYIKPGDMTGSLSVSLFRNGKFEDKTFNKSNILTESNLNGFVLKSAKNEIDPYSIVKITHDGETTIYSFEEIEDIYFADGGVYDFVLADRLGNTVSFTLIITSPVGFADVRLELEQEDNSIITEFRVFVGQEIELPVPTLESELFVFDGWLYDDTLITDNKFRPMVGGTLHVWQQITQKYTYISFDSNGGTPVDKIKVEIGEAIDLPVITKDGWAFGGWQYGGNVYNGAYVPTTASPTFVAVWNYEETKIELYDGNLYQSITARVGDKVLLPFPAKTGYTFFGWREELSDGSNKVYYGQITNLANVKSLKLDALWIRESSVTLEDLSSGTGGRTMVHFVDGALLQNDSLQGATGTSIALPKPTRAGFTFIGWVWRTTSVSGKIYNSETMTIPAEAGDKLMLEALWTAKPTANSAAAGTLTADNGASGGFVDTVKNLPVGAKISAISLLAVFAVACAGLTFVLCRRRRLLTGNGSLKTPFMAKSQAVLQTAQIGTPTEDSVSGKSTIKRKYRRIPFSLKFDFCLATVCVAMIMACIMSFTALFSSWQSFGGFKGLADYNKKSTAQAETLRYDASEHLGSNWQLDTKPTKEEVLENFEESNIEAESGFDLTEEEAFLYSLIMLDLYSLGYLNVFPAEAVLSNNEVIRGFGYTSYDESYKWVEDNSNIVYYDAGFVALPRQTAISDSVMEQGVKIYDCNNYAENDSAIEIEQGQNLAYILLFTESYGPCHYVSDGRYVVYSVEGTDVKYSSVLANEKIYNPQYGSVYSYDEGRIIFESNLGQKSNLNATSLNTMLDPVFAQGEYQRYITEQTANGFTVDTMNFVYISYESLNAYYLSQQDESLLGIDVQEFYDMERTVGPNEYYTVDADGNLTKLEFPPKAEDKASWLDRLAGAVLAIGMICVGVIIVAAIEVASGGTATLACQCIMGAFIGAGMEVFMQTVVQGNKIEDINWLRVGIAAVSGAVAAIPGIGWFGAGLIQGVTEAALTAVDGGSLTDVLISAGMGFVTGVAIHGAGKAVGKLSSYLKKTKQIKLKPTDVYAYKFKIKTASGKEVWYVGKGTGNRLNVSEAERLKQVGGEVVERYVKKFKGLTADRNAFIQEAKWMNKFAKKGINMLNKIASPGFKKGNISMAKDFRQYLFKAWYYK